MFKTKIKFIFKVIFPLLALTFFVADQGLALSHNISHHEISTADQPLKKHHDQNCVLCFSANFQNHIFAPVDTIFVAAVFYLAFFAWIFDRVKLSYLLFSKAPRAPPFNS